MKEQRTDTLVSVIIPTFRRPDTVKEAIKSAVAQTWRELEILVVSDGPDPALRASLEGADARIRYLELPTNQGPAAARNAGVIASRGEWLCFLDDDDLMLPGKVEAQMRLSDPERTNQMVSCRTVYHHGNRHDIWPEQPIAPNEDIADYILLRRSIMGRPGLIPIQTLLMHRSVVEAVPFSSHNDHEDWAWLLEAWHRHGARVVFAWEPLVIYNIATDSLSRSRRPNWEDSLDWALAHRKWIGDRAFCSFLATKAALKARRAGDWRGVKVITRTVLRNRPGLLELAFLGGVSALPGFLLQKAWKRSLQSDLALDPRYCAEKA